MRTLSRRDLGLTLQFLPLVASVRWKLWRLPFPRLHQEWHALVQSELNRAAQVSETGGPIALVSRAAPGSKPSDEVWRCAHAVRRAARLVPRGSCLTQAMALQLILARRGQPCSVRIGVDHGVGPRRGNAGQSAIPLASAAPQSETEGAQNSPRIASGTARFEAHAWVEWQGRVIMGGDITRWKPLTVFAPAVFPGESPLRSGEVGLS